MNWTVAHQTPLPFEFSRQEFWSRLLLSSSGDLPDPGIEPTSLSSPALAGRVFYHCTTWEALLVTYLLPFICLGYLSYFCVTSNRKNLSSIKKCIYLTHTSEDQQESAVEGWSQMGESPSLGKLPHTTVDQLGTDWCGLGWGCQAGVTVLHMSVVLLLGPTGPPRHVHSRVKGQMPKWNPKCIGHFKLSVSIIPKAKESDCRTQCWRVEKYTSSMEGGGRDNSERNIYFWTTIHRPSGFKTFRNNEEWKERSRRQEQR